MNLHSINPAPADGDDAAGGMSGAVGSGSLELVEVSKSYGSEQVLKPTSLQVRSGEFLTILGPSGSGKTTVLRLIGGFTQATSGRIMLDGRDITRLPPNRRPCNTVFQDYALFPHRTAFGNVGYGLMVRGSGKEVVARKVAEALRLVGLEGMSNRYPPQLSGGQQQRVALARSLICEPRVLLLDEPLSALDAEMRRQMQLFLKKIQREVRTTFFFVTHDQEEAIIMSDRIAVMSAGQVEQIGTPYEIYYRPKTHFVATFMGDNNIMEASVADTGAVEMPFATLHEPALSLPSGARAIFAAIRPERVALGWSPVEGRINLKSRIVDVAFAGAMTAVRIVPDRLPNRTLLVKIASGKWIEDLAPGTSTYATFDPNDLSFFARQAP